MWKIALLQGPNVQFFEAAGTQRKAFNDFPSAVAALLKDGWEPFAADSHNTVLMWFRMKVG